MSEYSSVYVRKRILIALKAYNGYLLEVPASRGMYGFGGCIGRAAESQSSMLLRCEDHHRLNQVESRRFRLDSAADLNSTVQISEDFTAFIAKCTVCLFA